MKPQSLIPIENLKEMQELLRTTPHGTTVEVGVYKGGSAYALWEADPERPIWLFDTFTGIPFQNPGDDFAVGTFADTAADAVQRAIPSATIFQGVFPETFPGSNGKPFIGFVHLDADQYESTRSGIATLWPLMLPNAIICFDDYPISAVRRAIDEKFGSLVQFTEHKVPYVRKPQC